MNKSKSGRYHFFHGVYKHVVCVISMIALISFSMIPVSAKEEWHTKGSISLAPKIIDNIWETIGQNGNLEESLIVDEVMTPGAYSIMGRTTATVSQMITYYQENSGNYPSEMLGKGGAGDIEAFANIYYEESIAEGVRAEVAFAQTMKETGWLQYGGDSKISQFNFAGLGTTGGGVEGNAFPDVRTGVRAQIQHLKAYASDLALNQPCVDARYGYVTKGCAPFVEWLGQQENPSGTGWAVASGYGYDIVGMIWELKSL
ncbi:glucosaminidase domain-containing protein [Lachnospiraceae bacterium LCP25S3_G4]